MVRLTVLRPPVNGGHANGEGARTLTIPPRAERDRRVVERWCAYSASSRCAGDTDIFKLKFAYEYSKEAI